MDTHRRPLSPHLQIYKLPPTALLSITHRATGAALAAGGVLLAAWLLALASGPAAFDSVNSIYGSIIGNLILFGFSWALFFHLCNGIRHLFWDIGVGFELEVVNRTTRWVLWASIALTVLAWLAGAAYWS